MPDRKLLWLVDLEYATRLHHGATLRQLNYSRELIDLGCQVHFGVNFEPENLRAGEQFFQGLKDCGSITDFFPLREAPHVSELGANACIISSRRTFPLVEAIRNVVPVVLDFGDCSTLYHLRAARFQLGERQLRGSGRALRRGVESFRFERRYGRRSGGNVVVSSADKRVLDLVTGTPERNHVLLNGVAVPENGRAIEKIPRRLIFSGNMNFPPNYEAALWFIDNVLPIVRSRHPHVHLVVAGANPIPPLLARAGDHVRVTGYVEDMGAELAKSALYVAPLITGGGFKNKVVEALANGTFVVATPLAVEFLNASVREHLLVARSAREFANAISRFLSNPSAFDPQLAILRSIIAREFTWRARTQDLLGIVEAAAATHSHRQ